MYKVGGTDYSNGKLSGLSRLQTGSLLSPVNVDYALPSTTTILL